jgi:hypothetical protein
MFGVSGGRPETCGQFRFTQSGIRADEGDGDNQSGNPKTSIHKEE